MSLNQWKPKNNYSVLSLLYGVRLFQNLETVPCLALSWMVRMEMYYINLKKLPNFFKSLFRTDRVFGPKSTFDRSLMRKQQKNQDVAPL